MQVSNLGTLGLASQQAIGTGALNKTSRALEKILERLSTAQRINRASDDAAGLAVSEQLRTQIRGFKMATQNAVDTQSALNIAEGAGTEVESMLQRQRELAIQARNDTLTDDQRGMLDTEYQQITQEINRIPQATQFNTQQVAAGQGLGSGTAQAQVGANAGDQITLPKNDMTAVGLGVAGTSIASSAGASTALNAIDAALDQLHTQRSNIGAMVNRLESTINNLSVAEINTQAAESALRDQDMAKGLADLVQQQILYQGGTKTFARFNEISYNHLLGLLK
jgi:flagellin